MVLPLPAPDQQKHPANNPKQSQQRHPALQAPRALSHLARRNPNPPADPQASHQKKPSPPRHHPRKAHLRVRNLPQQLSHLVNLRANLRVRARRSPRANHLNQRAKPRAKNQVKQRANRKAKRRANPNSQVSPRADHRVSHRRRNLLKVLTRSPASLQKIQNLTLLGNPRNPQSRRARPRL
jgi:hypothetical protein